MSRRKLNLKRRKFLKSSVAVVAGLAGAGSARAQFDGIPPGVGTVPLLKPLGAQTTLDRNQYIHNMEIVAHFEGASAAGGEPRAIRNWARPHLNAGWDAA